MCVWPVNFFSLADSRVPDAETWECGSSQLCVLVPRGSLPYGALCPLLVFRHAVHNGVSWGGLEGLAHVGHLFPWDEERSL